MMQPANELPLTLKALTAATRLLPPVRGSGRIALSLAHRFYHGEGYCELPVWPGVRMVVNPSDCLGKLLTFVPHLYDRWERQAISAILRPGDVFVDVGSNIGVYALWAAHCLRGSGRVLAVEPEPANYRLLVENVRLNGFEKWIKTVPCGVSDKREVLRIFRNADRNPGAHNFVGNGFPGDEIPCVPLDELLLEFSTRRIRMIKLDIEGFERRVLDRYFSQVPSTFLPDYLLVEIAGGPAAGSEKDLLRKSILQRGYSADRERLNTLFRKDTAPK